MFTSITTTWAFILIVGFFLFVWAAGGQKNRQDASTATTGCITIFVFFFLVWYAIATGIYRDIYVEWPSPLKAEIHLISGLIGTSCISIFALIWAAYWVSNREKGCTGYVPGCIGAIVGLVGFIASVIEIYNFLSG